MLQKNLKKQQFIKLLLLLLALPFLVLALKKIYDLRKGAAGTPANIVITQDYQGKLPSSLWQNLAQGGEESTDMIKPVITQVKNLQPELIRVDHLFDYYQVEVTPGVYDFSKLDQVVNSIIATGAKPLLSISYTTASMSSNNQNAGEPKDWNQWYRLVQATASRYSIQKNIQGIYYEIWNEPDLFGAWHYAKSPNYLTLYTHTSRAIRDGAQGSMYKIGGPATTKFYTNWIKSLAAYTTDNNLPLDFVSWHQYSKNMDDYEKDVNSLIELSAQYPKLTSVERLITEAGPNPEPDSWYDNKLSGIHLISLSTRMAGKVHRVFPFEIIDGPTKRTDNSSGWGMITHASNGLRLKPRYHAVQFLNKLSGNRITSWGDGSWVTAIASKNSVISQVLLVNYDPGNTHTETVPVSFQGISPGTYQIKTTQYLGGTASRQSKTVSSVLTEHFYLEPNSAIIVELIPVELK